MASLFRDSRAGGGGQAGNRTGGGCAFRGRRARSTVLRALERLEDRTLLATVTWGNAAGGDWNTGSNWVGGMVPGAGDDAVIPGDFPSSITITYSSGTSEIQSLTSAETIKISGGSFQIDAALTASNITQSGGTLTGAGDLTVAGTYSWTGGTQDGGGATILQAGAEMDIGASSGSTVTVARAIDNTAAPINWNYGTINGTWSNPGQLNINTGYGSYHLGGTLTNAGTITWTGSYSLQLASGAVLDNQAGATIDINTSANVSLSGITGSQLINAGTLRNSGGSNTIGVAFTNIGLVQAQAGRLSLSGGGTYDSGEFDAASGGTLLFSGGTNTLAAGASFTGAGTIGVSGGTTSVGVPIGVPNFLVSGGNASIDVPNTMANVTQSGGTLTGDSDLTVTGTYSWTGGTQDGGGATVLQAGAEMDIGTLNSTVTVARVIDNTAAPINWNYGTINGTWSNPGQLNMNAGYGSYHLGGTLTNAGTITWTGSYSLQLASGARLDNEAGATIDINTSANVSLSGSTGSQLINAGTLENSGGSNTIGVALTNIGLVQAQAGRLSLSGGGTYDSGEFDAASGGTLLFSGGTNTLAAGASFTGAGTIGVSGGTTSVGVPIGVPNFLVSGGNASIDVPNTMANVTQSGGTLTGDSDLTVTGTYSWTGGTQDGGGATVLQAGAEMDIGTLNSTVTVARVIDNTAAPINWNYGTINGTWSNPGQLNMNAGYGSYHLGGTLTNAGTITWTGSYSLQLASGARLDNEAGATIDINTSANVSLSGSTGSQLINAGTLENSGGSNTIGVALSNTGLVRAQAGTLSLGGGGTYDSGEFDAASGGTLLFSGGTNTLAPGASLTGAGTIGVSGGTTSIRVPIGATSFWVKGGTVSIDAPVSGTNVTQSGGALTGSSDLTVRGSYSWTGGTQSGSGQTILAAGSQMTIAGNVTVSRIIDDTAAPINWTNGEILGSWTNPGQLNINTGSAKAYLGGTLNNTGSITKTGTTPLYLDSGTLNNQPGGTFDVQAGGSAIAIYNATTTLFSNAGTLKRSGAAGTATIDVPMSNTGVLDVENGTLSLPQITLVLDGSSVITGQPSATVAIGGDLTGGTTNVDRFKPPGTMLFNGAGTATAPQRLEVMSQDRGPTTDGFARNFSYGTLTLGSATYVQLVDDAVNSGGTTAEAVYANALVVPSNSTLDLHGLDLYVRTEQISGTVVGGTITRVSTGGSLSLNTPVAGSIEVVGAIADWSVFGRAGQVVSAILNLGTGAVSRPIQPYLNFAQVQVVDADGQVLATASNSVSGTDLSLSAITLPADGVYHIQVQAPAGHSSSTGNYILTLWDAAIHSLNANLNQAEYGQLVSPYISERWSFTAQANQQITFNLLGAGSQSLRFDLTGPNGFVGFTGLSASSGLVDLPTTGTYVVTAYCSPQGTPGAYSFRLDQTALTDLAIGTPYQGSLNGTGQELLFRAVLPDISPLRIDLGDSASGDSNELYAKLGAPPTRDDYQFRSSSSGPSQEITLPSAAPGVWYFLVYAGLTKLPPTSFTLTATASEVFLSAVNPAKQGDNVDTTVTLTGSGFNAKTAVSLVAGDRTIYPLASVSFDSPTQIRAIIPAGAVPDGTYTIAATQADGSSAQLPGAFTVLPGGKAVLKANLIAPQSMGATAHATLYVQYSNTGTVAMPAPVLVVSASRLNADGTGYVHGAELTLDRSLLVPGYWTSAYPVGFSPSVQILGSGSTPGVLEPGESVQVPVYYAGWDPKERYNGAQSIYFSFGALQSDTATLIDWNSLEQSSQPPDISATAWSAIFANIEAETGPTWGDYVRRLDDEAQYLDSVGDPVNDIGQLYSLELQQADGLGLIRQLGASVDAAMPTPGSLSLSFGRFFTPSIIGSDTMGPFGLGWSDAWQTSLSVLSDGTVVISAPGGLQRTFQPDRRTQSHYFDEAGDYGTLTPLSGGAFKLTEQDGTVTAYSASGALNYVQDTNGNRITAAYVGGRLASLTASSGPSLSIVYNASGLIASVTDSAGRATTYAYDATAAHLVSVTNFDGTQTLYSYDTSTNLATENALLSITYPDGTHAFFTYDPEGRFASMSADGGAEMTTFSYGPGAAVAATDGLGNTLTVYFDHRGLVAKATDALDRSIEYNYDNNYNLTQITDPAGHITTNRYDSAGNLTSSTDPLGNVTQFSYTSSFDRLASVTDANANATRYAYDGKGNLSSTTYADGTIASLAYDPVGNVVSATDQNGQVMQYAYNAAGQVLTKTYADGTVDTFAYDARGNLTSTTDPTGTTTLTYDTNDRLIQITYPTGLYLEYTDDDAGRRIQMVDQDGFTVNYAYDSVGRLSELTDASGALVVHYTYDDAGNLVREDKGNGTYTTYTYDNAGELLDLINYAPDGSINSSFVYTYNTLGLRTSEATVDGTWTYSYDGIAELTHAVFMSTNLNIPNQDETYNYDAVGNRTSTVINGVTTVYTTNIMNQYTQVGATTYAYDRNGNMVSATDGGGTTAYAYDQDNRLVGLTSPSGAQTLQYDSFGFQVIGASDGQQTQHLIDPFGLGTVVSDYDGSGSLMAHYTYGLGLTSQVDASGAAAFYHFDALGSTAGITGATGSLINTYSYDPFGNVLAQSGSMPNPFQFAGTSGVGTVGDSTVAMRARVYLSTQGRFTTPDPTGMAGGLNLYQYAVASPTNLVDFSGRDPLYPYHYLLMRIEAFGNPFTRPAWPANLNFPIPKPIDPATNPFANPFMQPASETYVARETTAAGSAATTAETAATAAETVTEVGERNVLSRFVPILGEVLLARDVLFGSYSLTRFAIEHNILWAGDLYNSKPLNDATNAIASVIVSSLEPALTVRTYISVPGGYTGDPNAKFGPAGYGPEGLMALDSAFTYRIEFENAPDVTAPAQRVVIADQLDANLDWSTLQLTGFGFGDTNILIPSGSQYYVTTVPMTENGESFEVDIEIGLDAATGLLTAVFQAIVPNTELPPEVLTGFLPPEDGTGRGIGFITYIVDPRPGLSTGTQIRNVALVTFDANPSISTDQVNDEDPTKGIDPSKQALNTIDAGTPTSAVAALPATYDRRSFTVQWAGSDDPGGSGIATYDVFVSIDGGPFTLWQDDTADTSAIYTGLFGHTYAFSSAATDHVGNIEPPHANPDTQTTLVAPSIYVDPIAGLTTTEAGGTASFTVVLGGEPTADVTIGVVSSDPSEGTAAPSSLVFTTDNWDQPQTVTVTGVDDTIRDGDVAYTIVLAPAVSDDPAFNGFDPADVDLVNRDDEPALLKVVTASPTTDGVEVQFNRTFDATTLNLYGPASLGPADLTLVGATVGPVPGSLVVYPDQTGFTLVKTGGPLLPDAYTLTLRSALDGFADTETSPLPLDGNGDNVTGDDFVTSFTIEPLTARVISIPDFARGLGQSIDLPATAVGLPVRISDADGVRTIAFHLAYNPDLLTLTGASTSLAGASVSLDTSTPGLAQVYFSSPTALPAGATTFIYLTAEVPTTAPYSSKEVLDLSALNVNEGQIVAVDDDGVHVVAYFGDTTGNGGYSGLDVALLQRVIVGLDSGFGGYQLLDPIVVGDISGNGSLSGLDVAFLQQAVVGISQPLIPPRPPGVTISPGGPDPKVSIPRALVVAPGQSVSVPVNLEQTNPSAQPVVLQAFDLALDYDPRRFKVTSVTAGTLLPGFQVSWSVLPDTPGRLAVTAWSATPITLAAGASAPCWRSSSRPAPMPPLVLRSST